TLPPDVMPQDLPPHLLMPHLHMPHQQLHNQFVRPATDEDLIDMVKRQWISHLSILNYFRVDAFPRRPFTRDWISASSRSKYYESFLSTCVFILAILLIRCVEYLLLARAKLRLRNGPASWLQFCILTIPFVICVTDFPIERYAIFSLAFNAVCVVTYLGCLLHKSLSQGSAASSTLPITAHAIADNGAKKLSRPPYNDLLAIYRSIVYISTTVCIFARDQPCWNNDFSKTLNFGTGLMDVGIGCFVICIGSLGPTANQAIDRRWLSAKAALQSIILTVCGLIKTLLVVLSIRIYSIEYDESWTEYGVHWNAYYSLAVARGLGATLELLVLPRSLPPLAAALASAAAHELLLAGGLAELVLAPGQPQSHNRSNLIGQNREGLASIPGLVTLYFCGLQQVDEADRVGLQVCRAGAAAGADGRRGCRAAADDGQRRFLAAAGVPAADEPAYCGWLLAFSCFNLGGVWLVLEAADKLRVMAEPRDSCSSTAGAAETRRTPIHLQEVDSTGLLYFLISNLLTGLLNLVLSRLFPNRESLDGSPCSLIILAYSAAAFSCSRLASRWFSFRDLQTALMQRLKKA
uniref:Phosphatidylinositol-glycan biosynthesis class W protein n=1 Tax=Macrostomum lignano TaxID=282301 RepID=A0A1I8I4M2_9PLAT